LHTSINQAVYMATPPSSSIALSGTIMPGHGVASGRASNSPYPQGSIAMQMPFFTALGLDLQGCWPGTLNVSIAPQTWSLLRADHRFENLAWTHLHPPETFSFARVQLSWRGQQTSAWLYRPHPETKAAHHQTPSVMEIIAPRLEGLAYGDMVGLEFAAGAMLVL
jgi:hypothetical protein